MKQTKVVPDRKKTSLMAGTFEDYEISWIEGEELMDIIMDFSLNAQVTIERKLETMRKFSMAKKCRRFVQRNHTSPATIYVAPSMSTCDVCHMRQEQIGILVFSDPDENEGLSAVVEACVQDTLA